MGRHPVHDAAHPVLADAVVQLGAAGGLRRLDLGALDRDPVVPGEVGRPGHQTGQPGGRGVDALVDGVTRGQLGAGLERRQLVGPPRDAPAGLRRLPGHPVAVPCREALFPLLARRRATGHLLPVEGTHLVGHPEGLVGGQAQEPLGHPDLVGPERRPVGGGGIGQLGRRPTDVAPQHQQRGLGVGAVARSLQGFADGGLDAVDVVGHLTEIAHVPAVGLETLLDVVVVGRARSARRW